MHKHSPCLNERHGMGSLAFEPADERKGEKPSLNAGSLAFKGGQLTKNHASTSTNIRKRFKLRGKKTLGAGSLVVGQRLSRPLARVQIPACAYF